MCAGVIVLGAVSFAAAVAFREAVVETVARRLLETQGFSEADLEALEVGLARIVLTPMRLGSGLEAERVEIEYDLWRLPRNPLLGFRVEGAVVDLESPGSAAWRLRDGGAAGGGPAIPAGVPEIEVTDAVVRVPGPYGPLRVSGSARIGPGPGGSMGIGSSGAVDGTGASARFRLDLRVDAGRLSGVVRLEQVTMERPEIQVRNGSADIDLDGEVDLPRGTARVAAASARFGTVEVREVAASLPFGLGREDETTIVRLEGANLRSMDPPIEVSAIVARVEIAENLVAEIRSARVEDRDVTPRIAPLSPSGRFELRDDAITFRGEVSAAEGAARATVSGEHDRKRNRGSGRLDLAPLAFDPRGVQPGDLVPALSFVDRVSGSLAAETRVRWAGDGTPTTAITLRPGALSFTAGGARVESLSGDVELRSLFPPVTPPDQELRARRVRFGIELEELSLRYALGEGEGAAPVIHIARSEARFSGGRLLLEDERFDPGAAENTLRLRLVAVDLDQLADALGAAGFEATGAVNGVIPIRFSAEGVAVAEGALKGTGPGIVRVSVETARRVLGHGEESLDLLLQALENFHYDELLVGIEKKTEGASTFRIHLDGRNPDLLDGRPFRIRVNVSADLDEVLAPVLEASRLTGRTLREIFHGLR